jgi:LuxR family maltose regulon positive regulatory protein
MKGGSPTTSYIALAHFLIARARTQPDEPYLADALWLIDRLIAPVEAGGKTGLLIELLTLKALALDADGSTGEALDSLTRALALAEPEGYVRVFIDAGQPIARLLYQLSGKISYTHKLLAVFPDHEPAQVFQHASALVEPLSEREVEVLSLVAEGLSNREIAQRLYLSLSTVKVHTHNIYGKLNVNNRTQAVAKAKALGILLNN